MNLLVQTRFRAMCTCVRQKTENSIFRYYRIFLLYYQNAFAFLFSVFYARTVLYIYTYLLVLFDLCTNHFRVYNSDLLYCILRTTGPAFFYELLTNDPNTLTVSCICY